MLLLPLLCVCVCVWTLWTESQAREFENKQIWINFCVLTVFVTGLQESSLLILL